MLHSIFFHRLFGVVKPTNIDFLGITFPAVRDAETENLVELAVDHVLRALNAAPAPPTIGSRRQAELEVIFTEKRTKKANWFNSGGEEEVPWETWTIKVTLENPQDREMLYEELSMALSKSVMYMIDYTASERGRAAVPLISTATGISPFPIHIRANGQPVT
ncbi:SubName: Full=Uncharacterized protein {ECO:0000313/EMBL:CCA70706.1} [Serendipita indica DSM 11827]|nr:SubName: Full=Uncharacterized protein {ECO:0000313/EMBL:CCA70706.1} [Serendipita indica DSM 11827]